MTMLYKKDARGALRFWNIEQQGDLLIKTYGQVGGEITTHEEVVFGNGLRDDMEQAESIMNSKIRKRIEKGYSMNKESAISNTSNLNELGLKKPMFARAQDKLKDIDLLDAMYQYKYNGHRCLITNKDGKNIAYSRNGKLITTVDNMLAQMDIPQGETIDGELYLHYSSLQRISSLVKRKQPDSDKLAFICYDAVLNADYTYRLEFISRLSLGDRALIAPTFAYRGSISAMLSNAIEKRYEGLMLRPKTGFVYQSDRRSAGLFKIKGIIDDEFIVTNIVESQDGWAVLECRMTNGKTFRVTAPGNQKTKRFTYENRNMYLGHFVHVEYAELTDYGIPFHPIATGWRNKHLE